MPPQLRIFNISLISALPFPNILAHQPPRISPASDHTEQEGHAATVVIWATWGFWSPSASVSLVSSMNPTEKCCSRGRTFLTGPGMMGSRPHSLQEKSWSHPQRRMQPSLDFLQGNLRQGAERDLEQPLTSGKRVGSVPIPFSGGGNALLD